MIGTFAPYINFIL